MHNLFYVETTFSAYRFMMYYLNSPHKVKDAYFVRINVNYKDLKLERQMSHL